MNTRLEIKEVIQEAAQVISEAQHDLKDLYGEEFVKRAKKAARQIKRLEERLQEFKLKREDSKLADRLKSALTDARRGYSNQALGRLDLAQVFFNSADRKMKRLEIDYKDE